MGLAKEVSESTQSGTRMTAQEVQELYTEKGEFYHHFFIDFIRYGKALKAFLKKSRCLASNMKVLDAGCGTGILTRNLCEIAQEEGSTGITFNAFDLTPAMLGLFRKWISENGREDIKLHQANVLEIGQLPQEWRNYDLVVSSGMLEYLSKDELGKALRNFRDLLGDNGTLAVCITRRNFFMKWLIQYWWKANMYTREEIAGIFRDSGFEVQFSWFPFPYTYISLWGFAIVARKRK